MGALVLCAFCGVAGAATFTVNTQADSLDVGACAAGATCSLRDAIIAADAAGGASSVTVPAGDYVLSVPSVGRGDPSNGDLDITGSAAVTVTGAGSGTTTIDPGSGSSDGVHNDRAFAVQPGATLTLTGVTIRDGSPANASTGAPDGGAIYSAGTLTVVADVLTSDTANGAGGAIRQTGPGTLTVSRSVFSHDQAVNSGGAISDDGTGPLILTADAFGTQGQDSAQGYGGAVYDAASSSARIVDSIFASNESGSGPPGSPYTGPSGGAALALGGASYELDGDTFSGSSTPGPAVDLIHGSLRGTDDAFTDNAGGAILSSSSQPLSLTNTTFNGNVAATGGGIDFSVTEPVELINDTFWDNTASTTGNAIYAAAGLLPAGAGVQNTIFGAGAAAQIGGMTCASPSGTSPLPAEIDNGHNLATDGSCLSGAPGDVVNSGLALLAPAGNGGAVSTDAEPAGAPSIDAGAASVCPAVDARGVSRPQGAACDIGAYEFVPTTTSTSTTGSAPTAPPSVTTRGASRITSDAAFLEGRVDPRGMSTVYAFQVGPTTAYGLATVLSRTDVGPLSVASLITGLRPSTIYHYRLLASSAGGVALGADRTFKTAAADRGRVLLAHRTLSVHGGKVSLTLNCTSTQPCRTRIGLTVPITLPRTHKAGTLLFTRGSVPTVTIRARRSVTVSAPVSAAALALLGSASRHRLSGTLLTRPLTAQPAAATRVTLVLL